YNEPIEELGRANLANHRVELGFGKRLRPAQQGRQEARGRITGAPELACELVLRLQPLSERPKLREVYTVIVAAARVDRTYLRLLELGELEHDLVECSIRHDSSLTCSSAAPGHDASCAPACRER